MKNTWVVKNGLVEIAILLMMLLCLGSARAQAPVQVEPGVGRISLIHGDVSTQRGDSGDWAAATLNAPIVSGDKVSTAESSRAEVQLDYSNILRLGNRTQANITTLSRTQIQIQVGEGIVNYTVFKDSEPEPEIDTPNVSIHPYRKDGSFRIETFSNDETRITVRNGEADVTTPQGNVLVKKGQMITVQGTGDGAQYQLSEAPGKDDWDRFNHDRDNMIHSAESWRHTNRYYVGSEDLDAYGHWDDAPGYGRVCVRAVDADWVPYRDGRWVWEPYYGWTWVSYEPWGWAPYHYGRWFYYGASWVWWPGPVYYRPIWAPAYVSFFGFGVGVGFGHFGWLPIGPCDPFFPWYGRHGSRFNEVNIVNITNITNIRNVTNVRNEGFAPLRSGNGISNLRAMNDPQVRRAFSTVPAEHFGTGRVVATSANPELLRNGHLMTGNLPVVPSRESLLASNRAANPATLPRGEDRRFLGRQAAAPQRFDDQAAQVRTAIQRDGRFTPIQAGGAGQTEAGGAELRGRGLADSNRTPNGAMGRQGATPETGGRDARLPGATDSGRNNGSLNNPGRSDSPAQTNRGFGQRLPNNGDNNQGRSDSAGQTRDLHSPDSGSGNNNRGWQRFPSGADNSNRSDSPASTNNPRTDSGSGRENRGWGQRSPNGGDNPGRSDSPAPTNNPRTDSGSGRENRGWGRGTSGSDNSGRSDSPAPTNNPGSTPRGNDRGWQMPSGGNSGAQDTNRGGDSSDSNREPRGWGRPDSAPSSSRPPLDMRQPVVTPRSSGGGDSGGGSRGGSSSPSGGSRGGSSNPSGGSRSSSSSGDSRDHSDSHDSQSASPERGRSR